MTRRYATLYRLLRLLTVLVAALGLVVQNWPVTGMYIAVVGLILLVGLPHGATDYLIFRHLTRPFWGTRSVRKFFQRYLLLMLGYGLLWWIMPTAALALFLLLSMYHFGQSNWHYLDTLSTGKARSIYLMWGAFVVLAPVLGHYEETAPIIADLIGGEAPELGAGFRYGLIGVLFLGNLIGVYMLRRTGRLDKSRAVDEWINLVLLAAAFATTPALLGFTLYFVGWHSLSSIADQITFFRQERKGYGPFHYLKDTLPLTVLALIGLGLLILGQYLWTGAANLGALFIFIAVVTLPHMVLLEKLYDELQAPDDRDPLLN